MHESLKTYLYHLIHSDAWGGVPVLKEMYVNHAVYHRDTYCVEKDYRHNPCLSPPSTHHTHIQTHTKSVEIIEIPFE